MPDLVAAVNACERVLDALRVYDPRDAAIDAIAHDVESARATLLDQLYGGTLYLEAAVLRDRAELGAEDEPTTRDAQSLLRDELRRLADELP